MNNLPRNVAFLDIGTNTIHLLMVRINVNHSIDVLTQQKEMVRLGDGEFIDKNLQPLAMQRAILVCQKFCDMARSRHADEIIAVATSATREAANQRDFINKLNEKTQLKVRIVTGKEEAQLIYLGVSSGFHLDEKQALFVDIGGGSTELIIGDQHQYSKLISLHLGAVRLANGISLPDQNKVVKPTQYDQIRKTIRPQIVRAARLFQSFKVDLAIGSSGTIINLGEISSRMVNKRRLQPDDELTLEDLKATIQLLCSRDIEERRLIPGINPDRADIIIPGAAILDVLMDVMHLPSIHISQRGLRDGLLVDYLTRNELNLTSEQTSIRERSVLQLARTSMADEDHAQQVRRLALQLFDSAGNLGLHQLGSHQRKLLGYAALLHDIGTFLSYDNHHAHTYYLIRNADLLGFNQTDISIMACTALFHRKGLPSRKQPELAELNQIDQEAVRVMSMFLRLAESLDRSHRSVVTKVSFSFEGEKAIQLEVEARQDDQLELWGVESHKEAFKKTFGLNLVIQQGLFRVE